jgi:hypothetical protein
MDKERRRAIRFQFIAPVEILDESGGQVTTFSTDLGLHGCSMGATHPPRKGSAVQLKIRTSRDSFEAQATVVHSSANRIGVAFHDVKPTSLTVLRRWLAAAKFPKASARPTRRRAHDHPGH